jgi:hypothetical protein
VSTNKRHQSHKKIKKNKNILYTHFMAHVLKLVFCHSNKTSLEVYNPFMLVEKSAVFLYDFYKKQDVGKI